jgi:agmatinase
MAEFYPYNFGGLPEESSSLKSSRFAVLQIPYEATTTYGKGTKRGPAGIIEASRNMELYDEELRSEPFLQGIFTSGEILFPSTFPEMMVETVSEAAAELLEKGKIVISLGGEHSISYPLFLAHRKYFGDIGVLQIDAHLDLRDSYEGSPFSHASVMRRIYEKSKTIVQVGIRSYSKEEADFIRSGPTNIFWAKDIVANDEWIERAVSLLPEKVYLTVDVDGLDPSIMPATGTPEPGGMGYYQTLKLIRTLAEKRNIIGADFVELAPIPGHPSSDFLVSKLIYKTIGYMGESAK